jgi:cytidylate kinase
VIVTIDGPAGAGKSTAARRLAGRLGFDFLDTGAMYRAVALAWKRTGVAAVDEARLAELVDHITIEVDRGRVLLQGEDVTEQIRTAEVTRLSRAVADSPAVRSKLSALQRQAAMGRNIVSEGRDQGTVVFPDAGCKFFLTADPEERARRRQREMVGRGEPVRLEEVLQAQTERDARDRTRAVAPMVPAADALVVDTTHLDLDAVVDFLEEKVRARHSEAARR